MTTGAFFAIMTLVFGSLVYSRIKRSLSLFIGLLLMIAIGVVVGTTVINSRNSNETTTEVSMTNGEVDMLNENVTQAMFPSETWNTALTLSELVTKHFYSKPVHTLCLHKSISPRVRNNSPPCHNTS